MRWVTLDLGELPCLMDISKLNPGPSGEDADAFGQPRDVGSPVLAVALEMTRVSLGLTDDRADGIIAKQIVELAKTGERNPDLLREAALKKLHEHLYSD